MKPKIAHRKTSDKETKIMEIPTYNLTEYAELLDISYSKLSKKKTGHTLISVKFPRRRERYLHPEIASIIEKHLEK